MTITVTLPEGWFIAEILEEYYRGSAVSKYVIPALKRHAGEVLDANGFASMLYRVSEDVKPLLATTSDGVMVKGDFEVITMALCSGCGPDFIAAVVTAIEEIQELDQLYARPPAEGH